MWTRFHLGLFDTADLAALAWLVLAWALLGWLTEYPPKTRPSVSVLMSGYRREWMRQMVTRDPRIFDSGILDSLRVGSTFYASACMIAIGGIVATISNPDRAQLPAVT